MSHRSSPGIVLRIIEHGDYDKILTCFTLERGKISLIAKGARKSIKRFAGVLELFSILDLVWTSKKNHGMAVLQEAVLVSALDQIRADITRTAYASCWCEMVYLWMEEGQAQPALYRLLQHVLTQLHSGNQVQEVLHITFQVRFLAINGFRPVLDRCCGCSKDLNDLSAPVLSFDVRRGGIVCKKCCAGEEALLALSKGTAKLLGWVMGARADTLDRVRFSRQALEEGLRLLEVFVPYHLGKETKSLKILKQLRHRLPH
jgi:DNA repair protein RecO (recombination protein O)